MTPPYRVLFLCTANSARSILAEALINDPRVGQGKFIGYSAGSHPRGEIQPLAVAVLAEEGFSTTGLRSKSWNEFAGDLGPPADLVITVCDNARAEVCPIWPGHPLTAHWDVADPAGVSGSDEEKRRAYREALRILRRRIEFLSALPLDTLSGRDLQERIHAIGRL